MFLFLFFLNQDGQDVKDIQENGLVGLGILLLFGGFFCLNQDIQDVKDTLDFFGAGMEVGV